MKNLLFFLFSIIPLCSAGDISLGNYRELTVRRSGHFNTFEQDKERDDRFCVIDIKNEIVWGYELWPLVIDPSILTFKEVDKNGTIFLGHEEELRIACPGTNNTITILGSSDVIVKCENGEIFKHGGEFFSFYSLGCRWVNYN